MSGPKVIPLLVLGMGTPAFGKERRVVRGLREMTGVQPFFLTSKWEDGSVSRLLRENNFEFAPASFGYLGRAKPRWTLINLMQMPWLFVTVIRWYRRRRCQAILIAAIQTFVNAFPAIVCLKYLFGARLVFYLGDIPANSRSEHIAAWFVRRMADEIIANSGAVKRGLLKIGIRSDQVRVIYNGVDVERFRSATPLRFRSRFGWPEDTVVIGFAGQFAVNKGVWDFVRAAESILKMEPRSRFLFLGNKDEQNVCVRELSAYLQTRGLADHIVFTGWIDRMEQAYAALDVMVVPSRHEEPAANINIEAMASGIPVVATRTGGTPELIADGVTGILVEPASPARIAESVLRLVRDSQLRSRMGVAGRERVMAMFDVSKNARIIEKILTDD